MNPERDLVGGGGEAGCRTVESNQVVRGGVRCLCEFDLIARQRIPHTQRTYANLKMRHNHFYTIKIHFAVQNLHLIKLIINRLNTSM